MEGYFEGLTNEQKKNISVIINRMKAKGYSNPFAIAAILAVVSKESAFIPKNETSYRNTSNARIRKVFGSRLAGYSEADLTTLKQSDFNFFEAVYGGEYGKKNGNSLPGDGYKFRGRGFNGLTFRSAYRNMGKKIGVDLENNPDKVNDINVAVDALIQYYVDQFKVKGNQMSLYKAKAMNDFKSLQDALGAFYHATAGWGHSLSSITADVTGGLKKATDRVSGFLDIVLTEKKNDI